MSDKKRKSTSTEGERQSKRQQNGSAVQIKHVAGPEITKPVIATAPGVVFPNVAFQPYSKSMDGKPSLYLQSFDHATITYTAREDEAPTEKHLKHYIAVYDPQNSKLAITEARRLTVRGTLRVTTPARDHADNVNGDAAPKTNSSARAALTETFGTKKSKKAAQSLLENRKLTNGADEDNDSMYEAMLANVNEEDVAQLDQSLIDTLANKPLPRANLETQEIDQVYSLNTLVQPNPGEATLNRMPIQPWIESLTSTGAIESRSRFIATRIAYHTSAIREQSEDPSAKIQLILQILRYTQMLLDLHTYINSLARFRPVPPLDQWPEHVWSEGTPLSLVRSLVNRFFPQRSKVTNFNRTLLRTTILALTLHIPPPSMETGSAQLLVTDTSDISLDLALEPTEIRKLYRELGCKVAPASEKELTTWRLTRLMKKKNKQEDGDDKAHSAPKPTFARLKLPLEFPKLSRGAPGASKRR